MKETIRQEFEIRKVTLYKPEDGFFIAITTEEQKLIGTAIIQPHGKVTCDGCWENSSYGYQFKVQRIYYGDLKDIIKILLSSGFVKGIRESKCDALVDTLGERTFEVLDACVRSAELKIPIEIEWDGQQKSAGLILMRVKGIGPRVYKQIINSWAENQGLANSAVLAIRAGLTVKQFKNAIKEVGSQRFENMILHSPYDLTELDGFTWEVADGISSLEWDGKDKIQHDSPQRASAAVREVIRRNSAHGHTCMLYGKAIHEAKQLANLPLIESVIDWENSGLRQVEEYLTTRKWHDVTMNLATNLRVIMQTPFRSRAKIDIDQISIDDFTDGMPISDEQRSAVVMALSNNVSIITGQPGTGKSKITNTILNIMDEHGITYTICAPTGAAKSRITEVTGRPAHTLHKYFQFNRDDIDPIYLQTDYIFIDEGSMNDLYLFYMTVDRVYPGQRIIIIGDANQLPPVSPGEPLMQMIDAGIPTTFLKTILINQST